MEEIQLVDESGKTIGRGEKLDVHERALLHRAFSIFVFNSKGEVLLQQRAFNKYHSGGLWANTCCSHPRSDEKLEDAVHRRLKEEMGFDCPLEELFTFIYKKTFNNGLTEYEYDHVFKGYYDGEVSPNKNEVADYKWCAWHELKEDVKEKPQKYSYWLQVILQLWDEKTK